MRLKEEDKKDLDKVIQYAKDVEVKNGELHRAVRDQYQELSKYKSALENIRTYCKGCQAFFIAADVLDIYNEKKQDSKEKA